MIILAHTETHEDCPKGCDGLSYLHDNQEEKTCGVCSMKWNRIDNKIVSETMKTRKEWFSLLPPDVEEMALENNTWSLETKFKSMKSCLIFSFNWRKSPQGYDFWNEMANDEKYKN
jgi:hypothetical protein